VTRSRLATGRLGEQAAVAHLMARGWRIVGENWRCALGEVDIVAMDGPSLVIVEVRTRRTDRFGPPEDSIDARKRRKLVALGQAYVQNARWDGPWRIDVVAVNLAPNGDVCRLRHYPNAIGGDA
jgi:putative endonuclease